MPFIALLAPDMCETLLGYTPHTHLNTQQQQKLSISINKNLDKLINVLLYAEIILSDHSHFW